jgi:hypothetical protein
MAKATWPPLLLDDPISIVEVSDVFIDVRKFVATLVRRLGEALKTIGCPPDIFVLNVGRAVVVPL